MLQIKFTVDNKLRLQLEIHKNSRHAQIKKELVCLKLSFTPALKISSNFDIMLVSWSVKSQFVGHLPNKNVKKAYFKYKI